LLLILILVIFSNFLYPLYYYERVYNASRIEIFALEEDIPLEDFKEAARIKGVSMVIGFYKFGVNLNDSEFLFVCVTKNSAFFLKKYLSSGRIPLKSNEVIASENAGFEIGDSIYNGTSYRVVGLINSFGLSELSIGND